LLFYCAPDAAPERHQAQKFFGSFFPKKNCWLTIVSSNWMQLKSAKKKNKLMASELIQVQGYSTEAHTARGAELETL
jgi:hypothetical protein